MGIVFFIPMKGNYAKQQYKEHHPINGKAGRPECDDFAKIPKNDNTTVLSDIFFEAIFLKIITRLPIIIVYINTPINAILSKNSSIPYWPSAKTEVIDRVRIRLSIIFLPLIIKLPIIVQLSVVSITFSVR